MHKLTTGNALYWCYSGDLSNDGHGCGSSSNPPGNDATWIGRGTRLLAGIARPCGRHFLFHSGKYQDLRNVEAATVPRRRRRILCPPSAAGVHVIPMVGIVFPTPPPLCKMQHKSTTIAPPSTIATYHKKDQCNLHDNLAVSFLRGMQASNTMNFALLPFVYY